jgi:transposase-like protein
LYKCTFKEFRVHNQVVELESRYRTRSMNRDLKYSNGSVAARKFQSLVKKGWKVNGQKTLSFGHNKEVELKHKA